MNRPGCLHDALSALADGELSDEEARAARDHLSACPLCRAELAATEQMRSLVRSLAPLDLPPAVVERVGWSARRPSFVAAVAAGAVAAAASALFLLVSPTTDDPVSPRVGNLVEVHATSGNGDPVSQLTPAAVPVSFFEP